MTQPRHDRQNLSTGPEASDEPWGLIAFLTVAGLIGDMPAAILALAVLAKRAARP